jgi:hypothetical protein
MPLNPSIPLQVRVPQVQSPVEAVGRAMSLADMAQRRRVNDLAFREAQRKADEERQVREVFSRIPDPEKALPEIMKINPNVGMAFAKSIRERQKADLDQQESQVKLAAARTKRLGELAGGITDEGTFRSTLDLAEKEQLLPPEHAAQLRAMPWNPETQALVQGFQRRAMEVHQQLSSRLAEDAAKREAELHPSKLTEAQNKATVSGVELGTKQRESDAGILSTAATQGKEAYAEQFYRLPAERRGGFVHPDQFDAKTTPGAVQRVGMTPAQQSTADISRLNAENNVSTMELELRAAKGDPVAKAALAAEEGRRIRIAAAGRAMNQDTVKDAIETAAQSLAAGDLTRIRDITSMRSDQRLLVFKRARELNPRFSTGEIDRKIKMQDWVDNGKGAEQVQSFGTFLEHAGEASDAVNNIRLTKSKIINRPLNWYRQNASGDADYQNFMAALEPVRKEFEGFLLGGRALYAEDRRSAEIILDDNSSPAQIQAALKRLGHTAKARFNEMNHRYKRVMGQDIQNPFAAEAVEGARKIGVELGAAEPEKKGGAPASEDLSKLSTDELWKRLNNGGKR